MPPRKERIHVLLDTNVVVGYYLSRNPRAANAQIFRLWRDQRRLQLVVSDDVVEEYLQVLLRLQVAAQRIQRLAERLERRQTVTHITLGPRFAESRDPDDNIMLATAVTGKAKFLITHDHGLLDIPTERRRKFRFAIVTAQEFLARLSK